MSLLDRQIAFRDEITAGDDGVAPSSPGMAIYRDAYRGRLLAALETGFERTRGWVGEEAFAAAAAHYVLTQPPTSWTLDDYGAGFPEVLAALFADDPEVGELAWLEWHLSQAFAATDAPVLDPAELARAGHSDADWQQMRFKMAAGFAASTTRTNCHQIWSQLEDGSVENVSVVSTDRAGIAVWRAGLVPQHRAMDRHELSALQSLSAGANLGALAIDADATMLGGWLAQWLAEGIFSAATVNSAEH